MTALALKWPAKRGGRTFQPVRRGSMPYEAAASWYRPTKLDTVNKIMAGARKLARLSMRTREKSKRRGDLTDIDLQILETMLYTAMDWTSGKLDWTYQQIADATGRARDTIARSIEALEAVGILERMRRFIRTELEGQGPQVQQASNAYRVALPPRLAALLGIGAPKAPIPADALYAKQQRLLEADACIEADTGRATLGGALGRLDRAVNGRESRK